MREDRPRSVEASCLRRLPITCDRGLRQERRADDDEYVGHVEDGPVVQVDEIDDVATPHAVERVSGGSRDRQLSLLADVA